MEMGTTYTKAVSILGVETVALKELVVVCHALASKLGDPVASKELLVRTRVLEKLANQLSA